MAILFFTFEIHFPKILENAGVLAGLDMTPEAAFTKLAYVIGKTEWDHDKKKRVNLFWNFTWLGLLSGLKVKSL